MNKLPHLLVLFELYSKEKQSFRKIHRMIDLFESIIKTHTVVILSEYVRHNKLSDSAKGLLAQGLRTPSLGTWQLFSRVLFEELQKDDHSWTFADFPSEFTALDKALNAEKTNVIAMRNGYAHGATPRDEQCEADVQKFEPFLLKLMGLNWLVNTSFQIKDGLVFITNDNGGSLCLHPLLLHRDEACEASFAFFNDLKNDKVGLLNYPLGKHYKEREFYSEFLEILPLNEWKSSGNNEFQQRIDELTETFKGRTLEREKLLQFVASKNKGYLSIQGNPGIGKSALIAQFFKDLKHHEISKSLRTVEYFIRRGTQQAQVDFMLAYLIRRTDEYFPAGKEIRAEGKTTYDVQSQLFAKWRLWSEQSKGQRLLFLIDGLDEGAENNVLAYLPRENFENILIIYGSRPGGHKSIDDLWATLPTEHHTKVELQGLGKEDIRALIYEVANKYEIERESPWIDAVQIKSQGNPLYLKLLCDSIEHGGVAVNDVNALPDKIDEYYKAILNRYSQDAIDGDALLFSLFTFAAAQDYLTTSHIGHINNLGPAATQRVCTTLKEVLYENPLTEEVLDYQLFHESFREYLIREFPKEVQDATYRIIDFCSRWNEFEGSWEQRYALEHYAFHLSASGKAQHHETLLNHITSQPFTATQKKVLKNFEASKRLFQLALMKSIELQKEDLALEAALQLVDLKYEEANDASQVVALATSGIPGDIELALKRIEQFGGADKEGIQRKFTLYMLCLMELTQIKGQNNPNRKELIEKLLVHLDEHLPTDHSILSWSDFFSSYLVFLMACNCSEIGLDFIVVYKRAGSISIERIIDNGPYSDFQLCVLLEIARGNCDSLLIISAELAKQGRLDVAASVTQEALETARGISDNYRKSKALSNISSELAKQGKFEDALETARGISDDFRKSETLSNISSELAKQRQLNAAASVIEDAIETARGISDDYGKSEALSNISGELAKQGKLEEALDTARGISDESKKSKTLTTISTKLTKQGLLEEALNIARGINDEMLRSRTLQTNSSILAEQGLLEEALNIARGISIERNKRFAMLKISIEFTHQGLLEDALETARGITDKEAKSRAISSIAAELANQGQLQMSLTTMKEALKADRGISDARSINLILSAVSAELSKQGLVEQALETAHNISEERQKGRAQSTIAIEFAKKGLIEVSLETARGISDERYKSGAFSTISTELATLGQLKASLSTMQVALEIARGIGNVNGMDVALKIVSTELAKQGLQEEAIEAARSIDDNWYKSRALSTISTELAKHGKLQGSELTMQIALETARESGFIDKCEALSFISSELAKQGQSQAASTLLKEALETARGGDDWDKDEALLTIAAELAKQNKLLDIESIGMEISQTAERHNLWKKIASTYCENYGWLAALQAIHHFQSDEARFFYLKGWANSISLIDVATETYQQSLPYLINDTDSIEDLLQKYTQNQLFFGTPTSAVVSRLNRTLNIQWLLDICQRFPKEQIPEKSSINLNSWIDEISDPDDRDDVRAWADKVANGNMTEEKFQEKVQALF